MARSMKDLTNEYSILKRALLDPDYDLDDDNYRIIEDVRDFMKDYNQQSTRKWNGADLVELLLLRVRNKSAHVFAITLAEFPDFANIEERWKKGGYVDSDGFRWLAPW